MRTKYLDKITEGLEEETTNLLRDMWSDKHDKALSYIDTRLDYVWEVIEEMGSKCIKITDRGLYDGYRDSTTKCRLEDGTVQIVFMSIYTLEDWIENQNLADYEEYCEEWARNH